MLILFLLFLSYTSRRSTRLCTRPSDHLEPDNKNTSITLPGFSEVFPEMKFRWPKWLKDKNGRRKPCKTDNQCPFPTTCCSHPILYGEEKYCCSGWGRRELVPSYIKNYIRDW